MTLLIGAVLGAPVGAALLAIAITCRNAAINTTIQALRAVRGGHHARLISRPRPLRLLAHGTHELPVLHTAATGTTAEAAA